MDAICAKEKTQLITSSFYCSKQSSCGSQFISILSYAIFSKRFSFQYGSFTGKKSKEAQRALSTFVLILDVVERNGKMFEYSERGLSNHTTLCVIFLVWVSAHRRFLNFMVDFVYSSSSKYFFFCWGGLSLLYLASWRVCARVYALIPHFVRQFKSLNIFAVLLSKKKRKAWSRFLVFSDEGHERLDIFTFNFGPINSLIAIRSTTNDCMFVQIFCQFVDNTG